MSFKLDIPGLPLIPGGELVPVEAPTKVAEVAAEIKVESLVHTQPRLHNHYLGQTSRDPLGRGGYLFGCFTERSDLEALFSVNEYEPPVIEVTRLSAGSLKVYYKGVLRATMPSVPPAAQPAPGYIVLPW